jgi:hypothetical protein
MKSKTTYILYLTLGIFLFSYGCMSSSPHPIEVQATSYIVSYTPTLDGLLFRETERVATVFAIQTASTTPLPTLSETNTPTPAFTSTPRPFSKDDILISYSVYAGDGVDEITSCLNAYYSYRFVLYRDGHLIIFDDVRYLETRINQPETEIERLLSEIDETGISAEINNEDIQNPPTPLFMGGWSGSITFREKTISVTNIQSDSSVKSVTKVLNIIHNYRPKNLQPYSPKTISLWAFPEHNSLVESFDPTSGSLVLSWSPDAINLNSYTNSPQDISGDILSFLMQQIKVVPAFRRVEQNGEYYLILICPNFHQQSTKKFDIISLSELPGA